MQITIELPNDFVNFQSTADIEKDIRLSYALWLFKNSRVTLAKQSRTGFANPSATFLLSYAWPPLPIHVYITHKH
jgi:hypothetical protein